MHLTPNEVSTAAGSITEMPTLSGIPNLERLKYHRV